ncbi:DUF3632 domain-containing protein [Aspergillus glaucus CBS 516.65]|uniref:Transcription factor domain-containing protein n=1 Tax=Aspergillus glaucus CBS 516.65 TaxID=1160497 RepID=A0A1L9VN72_ASPGL|nr:hypothetical protein ASPGLDRAFT_34192 [Aspergillus glaucus CBS 516.65]OJJ85388.1 hypothetical protein ASPGLDRAFT_34192 [Aspergillus glaucus CBS 516.65]
MAPFNSLGIEYAVSHNPSEREQAIFDYLTTYLPADSSITPEEAVHHTNTLFPEDLNATEISFLYRFWQLVFCIGPQLDYQQEPMQRFVALLEALEILPDILQGGAYPGRNSHATRIYVSMAFGEQWNSLRDNKEPSAKSTRHLQNMNGLQAYMGTRGLGGSSSYALETISTALENEKLKEPQVRAAATWFTLRALSIYWFCQKRKDRCPESRGALWTGKPKEGYSIARWMFWRGRLAELCDRPDVEEETTHICRDATQAMDSVSKQVNSIRIVESCMTFLQRMVDLKG